ncbi:hypothetical protein MHU86_18249 [Fragilaria crotonensis]|nr:hypothetical protein MHU86_18249 [Fragilaria crotonensis]
MSFRASSTPSDGRRGVYQDDQGFNQLKTPPSRDDVNDSCVEQFRSYSPISLISEDDSTKPPPVPKRDNSPEELRRMVSFGSLELSQPDTTVTVHIDTDDDSSAHQEKSACSSAETAHASNMEHFSSTRTFKASNATKKSGTHVVEDVDVGMSRNERKVNRLKKLFQVPTIAAIAGEHEPDIQHQTNVHGDAVGTVSETEYRLTPGLGYRGAEDIDVVTIDAKSTKNLRFPTTVAAAGVQEPNVQHQKNEYGDLPCSVPEMEYIFKPDLECPSQSPPQVTEATIPAMDLDLHGENLAESGLRVANVEELFKDESVCEEQFRTPVHKKWCFLAVFVVILLGIGIPVYLTLVKGENSSPGPTTIPTNASSPTSSPSGTPTVSPTRDEDFDSIEEILTRFFGNSSTDQQSPQSKALAWMVNNDTSNLTADTSHEMEIKDRYILVVLYFAMRGDYWFHHSDFLSSKHHCLWNISAPAAGFLGITCDVLKQVIRLDLMRNGLNGMIPSEIRFLTKLEGLNLTGNNISGNLPSSLDQLTKLQGVDCSHNNLFGTIPPELFQISTLQVVKLGNNSLNGTLPDFDDEKGNVSDVTNSLAGTLSEGLGNLSSPGLVDLGNKSRSGTIPKSIGSHKALVTLILDNNKLKGSLPSTLGSLSKMEVFSANNNGLSGTIPTEMGRLTNLTRLELMSNELYGQIPSELGLLGELKILNLADNKFNGTVPTQLGDLSRLQTVHLENNSLGGDMESFCKNKASFLGVDCDGEIKCTCCTFCCNSSDVCTDRSNA